MPELGRVDWTEWLLGIMAAFVGGGSTAAGAAIAVYITDPVKYSADPLSVFKITAVVFVISGMNSMFAFLRQKSAPAYTSTTITTVVSAGSEAPQEKTN